MEKSNKEKLKEAEDYTKWVLRKMTGTASITPSFESHYGVEKLYKQESESQSGHQFLKEKDMVNRPPHYTAYEVILDFKGWISYMHPPENIAEEVERNQEEIFLNKQLSDLSWLMQTIMNRKEEFGE